MRQPDHPTSSDPDSTSPRVAVVGATGYVGGRLIPELLNRGVPVRALARTPAKLEGRTFFGNPLLTIARADVFEPDTLMPALTGIHDAYYLVHSLGGGADFDERDAQAARTFGRACAEAGVQRIIYLSGLGREDDPTLSEHLRSRHRTGAALREAGVPVVELRAAIIIGSGSASFDIVHDLVRKLPIMVTPLWVNTLCEPIAIRDVVEYLIGALGLPSGMDDTFEIGGGEVMTYRRMLQLCGDELGRRPHIVGVPVLTPRLSSWWLHLVTSVDFTVAQPLVEGLRSDVVCTDTRICDLIPLERTPYREALHRALVRQAGAERWSSWTDARQAAGRALKRPAGAQAPARPAAAFRRHDYRSFDTDLPPDAVFNRLTELGGDNGYGGGVDVLWHVRGIIDRLLRGPGLRRGRPPGQLHEGDPLDFWRVHRLDRPDRLVLDAEMLVPGTARLDFRVEPLPGGGSRLHQLATLEGDTLLVPLYWYAVLPVHGLVFQQLGRHIVEP